jgi:two-component system chemotaxis response regulator CheB
MPGHDIIVVGASAGGIETLKEVVRGLPPSLPAAVFVVIHLAPGGTSVLPNIISRAGPLRAAHPQDGDPITPGRIYIAPPDRHLLVKAGHMRLGRGPRENRVRPAVDPLFRTAAAAYDGRVIGVVLSGGLDDGSAGLVAIKARGGLAVVQDPETALFPGMPASAIRSVEADHIVGAPDMGALLAQLAAKPPSRAGQAASELMQVEADVAELQMDAVIPSVPPGKPSGFSCPECGGTLFELHEGHLTRYRCRVGHAYSPDSLIAEQTESVESALWSGLRALEESAALSRQVADRSRRSGLTDMSQRFEARAAEALAQAERLRQVLNRASLTGEAAGAAGSDASSVA